MSVDLYMESGQLAGEADIRMRRGELEKARLLYGKAARLQMRVFEQLPLSRPQTRGIVATSIVALLYKAGELDDALKWCNDLFASECLPAFACSDLQELTLRILDDQLALLQEQISELKTSLSNLLAWKGWQPEDTVDEMIALAIPYADDAVDT
jgi:hypothetical protein